MAVDRNGVKLAVGDEVRLVTAMDQWGSGVATINRIDGEDFYLTTLIRNSMVKIHRYGVEMEKIL